jgi:hypothetical protein
MCFVLYVGTSHPIPRREWRKDAPDLSMKSLTGRESPIAAHFSKPEVQYVGSTCGCGCDFPHLMFQNGEWPWFDDEEPESEQEASDRVTVPTLSDWLRSCDRPGTRESNCMEFGMETSTSRRRQRFAKKFLLKLF